MSENTDFNINNDNQETKKKQKPGLNAVRPDDYTEKKFKEMASDQKLSQTDFFEQIFWNYLRHDNQSKRNEALNYEGEINLIAKDLDNILINIKNIAEKAQDKIIAITSNSEQTAENFQTDINTLLKKVETLEKRNIELEKTNEAFTEIKQGLEGHIAELIEDVSKKGDELKFLKENNNEKDKTIRDLEKQSERDEKEIKSLQLDKNRYNEEITIKSNKIHNLELANSSLQSAVENMEAMKKAEIAAVEAKNQSIITELQSKLQTITESRDTAIKAAVDNLKTEMEAEKKLAMAEIKLELAESKEKLVMSLQSVRENKRNN